MCFEFCVSESLRKLISEGTLVVLRTISGGDMVWNAHFQARRFVQSLCRDDNAYQEADIPYFERLVR